MGERIGVAAEDGPDDVGVGRLVSRLRAAGADVRDLLFLTNKTTSARGWSPDVLADQVQSSGESGPPPRPATAPAPAPAPALSRRPSEGAFPRRSLPTVNRTLPRTIEALSTPALLLDIEALDANLRRMQDRAEELGVRLRPHIKTHKCIEIADRQRRLGAHGITVSTLEEAERFAAHGFEDQTWAFPVVLSRLDQAAGLADRIRLGITVDSAEAVDALERTGRPFRVWIEVDCGYGRSGVDPGSEAAVALASRIRGSRSLTLAGLLTHSGHAYKADSPARIAAIAEQERLVMVGLGARLRASGVDPGELSVGSTPAMSLADSLDGVDEARPGNYALYDYTQFRLGSCRLEDCALTVLATVVSVSHDGARCVTDAGALALSKDLGSDQPPHFGRVYREPDGSELDPDARVTSVSQEHGTLSRGRPIGSRVRILANHSCLTVACFDRFAVVHGTEVLDSWKIWRTR